jgi:hypothetical protein
VLSLQYLKLRPISLSLPLFIPLHFPFDFFNPLNLAQNADIIAFKAHLKNVNICKNAMEWGPVFYLIICFALVGRIFLLKVVSDIFKEDDIIRNFLGLC